MKALSDKMENYSLLPEMLKIERIIDEAPNIKSFFFRHSLGSKPGQFAMVWIPRVGEKPMSIAGDDGREFFITVAAVGPFSAAKHRIMTGQLVGIRGPLGNPFVLKGKNIALVAGGYGAGPMAFLAEKAIRGGYHPKNIHYLAGARNKDLLLFEKRMEKRNVNVHISTNDGSKGKKGFVTDILDELIAKGRETKHSIDMVYCCGPEMMEKAVFEIAIKEKIDCQISVERYMKCGIGICGSCCVDPTGWRMCVEGPVFDKKQLLQVKEFGVYHRDAAGKKVSF
ncbi:dihydroorotate dehydrogenase electron transfer subunit [Candidatus Woesearchaeota archaeon]|nr:dihydroorotate dehydrogenase electron transfer subunit [Candidatus Woesearchaeota archaeon]